MNDKIKILANYLPQFHEIPENNQWWGQGFTDWVSVRGAQRLYEGHNQPRVPLHHEYYSLDQVDVIRRQAELANKFGIDGFAIYHYWFSSDQKLLERPAELLLENQQIHIEYLFLWDNCSWKRTWSKFKKGNDWTPQMDFVSSNIESNDNGILAELKYGDVKDWTKHFEYLLPFFQDNRYIKENNRPIFGFFQSHDDLNIILKMVHCWDELARENGFAGIICIFNWSLADEIFPKTSGCEKLYRFKYTPFKANNLFEFLQNRIKDIGSNKFGKLRFYNYDSLWKGILASAEQCNDNIIALSGFVDFDDTPRRGKKGRIVKGASPEKFEKYFKQLLKISQLKDKKFVFLTAWNEWGEGAYLEPDETNGYAYLKAVKNAIDSVSDRK